MAAQMHSPFSICKGQTEDKAFSFPDPSKDAEGQHWGPSEYRPLCNATEPQPILIKGSGMPKTHRTREKIRICSTDYPLVMMGLQLPPGVPFLSCNSTNKPCQQQRDGSLSQPQKHLGKHQVELAGGTGQEIASLSSRPQDTEPALLLGKRNHHRCFNCTMERKAERLF